MNKDNQIVTLLQKFVPLKNVLAQCGFDLVLVGGIVRNLYLFNKIMQTDLFKDTLKLDYDFELNYIGTGDYEIDFEKLINILKEQYDILLCSFNVIKVNYQGHQIELAPAREESFITGASLGHSDFDVDFIKTCDYQRSFARRDFTINAMALTLENQLIDPFGGYDHIQNKLLHHCGVNFSKDPVRLLRAIRFQILFKLSFSNNLIKEFSKFDLSKLTTFYFFEEAFKSGDVLSFFYNYLQLCSNFEIKRPSWDVLIEQFSYCSDEKEQLISNKFDLMKYYCEKNPDYEKSIFKLSSILGIKKKLTKSYLNND